MLIISWLKMKFNFILDMKFAVLDSYFGEFMFELKHIGRKFDITAFYSAFDFEWNESFVFAGESHTYWEIVFITDGKVEATEDEKIYILEKGNMLFHAPMEFHRIKSADGTSPSGFIMSFLADGELPSELKEGIFTLNPEQIREYTKICAGAKDFLAGEAENPYLPQEISERLSVFLISLVASDRAKQRLLATPSAFEYRKIVSVMSGRVCENITLSEIAGECHISVSYIKLLFEKYAGISPKRYFANLRLQHIISLMRDGMSNAQIAGVMNFSSVYYFSVFFKKMTGMTASQYRRAL